MPPTGPAARQSASLGNSVALDQWRGLALLLVLISHGLYFTGRVHGIGRVGVNLFFFISGILVFRSLGKDRGQSDVALALDFWKRRLRRLVPALALFCGLMLAVTAAAPDVTPISLHQDLNGYLRSLPWALTYTMNYAPATVSQSLGHTWSLACEMQFYLLAPLIFLLGGRSSNRRHVVWIGLTACLIVAGSAGPFLDKAGIHKYHFEIAVWPMMLGFACEYKRNVIHPFAIRWLRAAVILGALMLFASSGLMLSGLEMKKLVIAAGAFTCVPCFFAYSAGWIMPTFAGRALAWLGERTYSIYLWQQPLTICRYLPFALHPLGAAVSVLVGHLSFLLVERPFLSASRKK